jgi:hypothetical protein
MASIADIPDTVLKSDNPDDLIDWLLSIPLPDYTRRDIARAWQAYTDLRLTPAHWQRLNTAAE